MLPLMKLKVEGDARKAGMDYRARPYGPDDDVEATAGASGSRRSESRPRGANASVHRRCDEGPHQDRGSRGGAQLAGQEFALHRFGRLLQAGIVLGAGLVHLAERVTPLVLLLLCAVAGGAALFAGLDILQGSVGMKTLPQVDARWRGSPWRSTRRRCARPRAPVGPGGRWHPSRPVIFSAQHGSQDGGSQCPDQPTGPASWS